MWLVDDPGSEQNRVHCHLLGAMGCPTTMSDDAEVLKEKMDQECKDNEDRRCITIASGSKAKDFLQSIDHNPMVKSAVLCTEDLTNYSEWAREIKKLDNGANVANDFKDVLDILYMSAVPDPRKLFPEAKMVKMGDLDKEQVMNPGAITAGNWVVSTGQQLRRSPEEMHKQLMALEAEGIYTGEQMMQMSHD